MIERMIGVAKLQVSTYEEVAADKSATIQAMSVVVLVAIMAGIGTLSIGGVVGIFVGLLASLVGWAVWALITYIVGITLFKTPETHADWGYWLERWDSHNHQGYSKSSDSYLAMAR